MTEHVPLPTAELLSMWEAEVAHTTADELHHVASRAAQWGYRQGADAELEACCEWFAQDWSDTETAAALRATRRPKPPSLKEQALEQLECVNGILRNQGIIKTDIIRRALEALPDD